MFRILLSLNKNNVAIENLRVDILDNPVLIFIGIFFFISFFIIADNLMNMAQMAKYLHEDRFENECAASKLASFNVGSIQANIRQLRILCCEIVVDVAMYSVEINSQSAKFLAVKNLQFQLFNNIT